MDRCFLTFKHDEPNQNRLLLLRFQLRYAIFCQFESSSCGLVNFSLRSRGWHRMESELSCHKCLIIVDVIAKFEVKLGSGLRRAEYNDELSLDRNEWKDRVSYVKESHILCGLKEGNQERKQKKEITQICKLFEEQMRIHKCFSTTVNQAV
ncbi:hypothetical protein NC652_020206 [Populus alba x Populus x berolinensis]|nr:hypothetical protein NC652_020206 [Populus alba x Populus x berolinensis]